MIRAKKSVLKWPFPCGAHIIKIQDPSMSSDPSFRTLGNYLIYLWENVNECDEFPSPHYYILNNSRQ